MTLVLGLTPLRIFWPLFAVSAVWLQLFAPGSDFFAPGIVLCLQRERVAKVSVLVVLAILIQEGTGPLVFGTGILRYGSLIALFVFGRGLFEGQSPVFIFLLGLAFSVVHFISLKTMAGLQSLDVSGRQVFLESLFLFGMFLLGWILLNMLYRIISKHEPVTR